MNPIIKDILFTIHCLTCFVSVFVMPYFIFKFVDVLLDKYRRNKYPEYFEYYDAGMDICRDAHDQATHKKTYFEYKLKLIYEGLRDGECTDEYFREYTNTLSESYIEFAQWFQEQQEESKVYFKKADAYAKEHNLGWGRLY
jgi:hypothetical protein